MIRVKAINVGYSDDKYRKVGDVFYIPNMTVFSKKWMELLDAPEEQDEVETPKPTPKKQSTKVKAPKSTGDEDVI